MRVLYNVKEENSVSAASVKQEAAERREDPEVAGN
jgi:hypothetical protein